MAAAAAILPPLLPVCKAAACPFAEPFLRLIEDPGQQYKPTTPPWLARAAEVASSGALPPCAAAPPYENC